MDMPTAACSPSSSAQPPPSSSDTGVDVVVDAGNDEERRRLLLDAAIDGNLDLLARDRDLAMLLLCKGADVGATNPRGTALHVAAMRGFPEVIRVLLRHGADPNKFASRVFTPLVSSLLGGSVECMKLLIEAGANVHAGGFSGATPLLLACSRRGNIGFVKCLLKAGADPNVPDELGRLPIEIAAVQGGKKLVQLLFPVTRCPPNMVAWSVAGIMSHVNSAAYKERVRKGSCKRKAELKLEGNKAYEIKDYDTAILMYNMALKFDDPNDIDASIYANKSLCWLRLGVGDEALSDAQACIRLWPDWGKGYYRQGEAFRFLQDYASAYAAFVKASELDPQNPKIANALRDLLERTKGASVSRCLEEGVQVQGRSQVLSGPCDQTVQGRGSFVQAVGRGQPLSSGQ
uniref:Ankyrin repeat and SOCS box-containing protein 14 n=1 Tax=Aegilops tauschii TaxID=37682 RepID=M8BTV2_AEGTA